MLRPPARFQTLEILQEAPVLEGERDSWMSQEVSEGGYNLYLYIHGNLRYPPKATPPKK